MSGQLRAPKGVPDVLPPASTTFLSVRDGLLAPSRLAGYGYAELPIFEDTALFSRGVGESTDVVTKEMYTFSDRGERSITLRPEGTAGTIRAILEHGLAKGALPVKLRYAGPMFRYERPQAGRFRQFQQVGIEAVGSEDPALDAEVVWLAVKALRDLGLTGVRLLVNSLGTVESRAAYRSALTGFLAGLDLDEDTGARAAVNPLRVLDDKRPEVQAMLSGVPELPDSLSPEDRAHHAEVLGHLDALGVSYEPAPRLVRGLDYYSRTTFELVHDGLGAQSAVGGGGRYDGLAETLGGPRLPGIGWALGVDRVLLALEAEGVGLRDPDACQVYVGVADERSKAAMVALVARLRTNGVPAELDYDHPGRGIGKIVAAASRRGARWAVYVGGQEHDAGLVGSKNLLTGETTSRPVDELIEELLQ